MFDIEHSGGAGFVAVSGVFALYRPSGNAPSGKGLCARLAIAAFASFAATIPVGV
jgi:hypothetical protein